MQADDFFGSGTVWTVGTPRCGVSGRVQRPELLQTTTIKGPRCAAEHGADSAARCPYPKLHHYHFFVFKLATVAMASAYCLNASFATHAFVFCLWGIEPGRLE